MKTLKKCLDCDPLPHELPRTLFLPHTLPVPRPTQLSPLSFYRSWSPTHSASVTHIQRMFVERIMFLLTRHFPPKDLIMFYKQTLPTL